MDHSGSSNVLFNISSTQQVLSMNKTEKCVDELLDGSVKLLDISGIIRELGLQIKKHVQVLQSAFRRRKGDSSIETSIQDYTLYRKKIKKDAKSLIGSLKQMDSKLGEASSMLEQYHHLVAVISEANASSSSILHSLLSILSTPISNLKRSKWSLVKNLVHKGAIACEEKHGAASEIECVDAFLYKHIYNGATDAKKVQFIHKQLAPSMMVALNACSGTRSKQEPPFEHTIQ